MGDLSGKSYNELSILLENEKNSYREAEEKCLKEKLDWEDAKKRTRPIALNIFEIEQEMRLIQDPEIEYGKEYKGERMTIDEFSKRVKGSLITDNEGHGYYATINSKSNIRIFAADVIDNKVRGDFSHVIWM